MAPRGWPAWEKNQKRKTFRDARAYEHQGL